jgi:hypothetical protein
MDLKDFYLNSPLDRPEYVRIKFTNIPKELIAKYKLIDFCLQLLGLFEMCYDIYSLSLSYATYKCTVQTYFWRA